MDVSVQISTNIMEDDEDQQEVEETTTGIKFKDWGFKVDRLFEVAHRFYKRNESKAFHPTFDERNQMNALILQAKYGNFDEGKAPDIGVLDLVGKNRRHQWSLLKGMSKMEAMSKFICTLDSICPLFKAYAEAVKISSGIQLELELDKNGDSVKNSGEIEGNSTDTNEQLKAIRTSLRRQTYDQFKSYAEKQYPNDLSKQKYLIKTLQEQYFQQYISQMLPEVASAAPATPAVVVIDEHNNDNDTCHPPPSPSPAQSSRSSETSVESGTSLDHNIPFGPLEPASIWTKKGVNEFKNSLVNDKHGGCLIIKQFSSLSIQVPTYPNGKFIYLEFITEENDIGFGLSFIRTSDLEQPLALKINEDDLDDESNDSEPILPVYRRNSHEEVFVGRHRYPGPGYYQLKFDNSYSLSSKSLFYRICHFI